MPAELKKSAILLIYMMKNAAGINEKIDWKEDEQFESIIVYNMSW